MIKKIHVLTAALFAVLAFVSIAASSAFAATHWLSDGETITALTAATTTGELALTDLKTQLGVAAGIRCSGSFDGSVGATGEDEITEVLSLTGIRIESLGTAGLACVNVENCSSAKVYPVGLPWHTQLELSGTSFIDKATSASGRVGYEVECTDLGVKITDECTKASVAPTVSNVAGGVEGVFNEGGGSCTFGEATSADIEGSGVASLNSGLSLAADDE